MKKESNPPPPNNGMKPPPPPPPPRLIKEGEQQHVPLLKRDELIKMCREAGFSDEQWKAMTYETGKYDITVPTVALQNLAKILSGRDYDINT